MTAGIDELVDRVPDGSTVAVGGVGLQRKPTALARALADAGRRDLRLVSWLGSVDVELLLACGCVGELHSAGVSLDGVGWAPRYRAARESGEPRFVEWSEGLMVQALQAASFEVPSLPTSMGVETDLPGQNPWLAPGRDPFTGEPVLNVRALQVDVALLHVPAVDGCGNAYIDGDAGADVLLSRAATEVVVTYEKLVEAAPERAAIGRIWVTASAPAPGGARPGGCYPHYQADPEALSKWVEAAGSVDAVEHLSPLPAGRA